MHKMNQKGFTLIEIAMVLIIVSLLLGGLITPLTAQIDQRNYTETKQSLVEVKEALIGFALSHDATANGKPYLPCPDTDDDGAENREASGVCTNVAGTVPTQSLGLQGKDAWDRLFVYRVAPSFSNSVNGFLLDTLATAPAPTHFMTVRDGTGTNDVTRLPVMVLSTGKNGTPPTGNVEELENTDGDTIFVSHEFTPNYDDIVIWVSPNILFNRLVMAGKLP